MSQAPPTRRRWFQFLVGGVFLAIIIVAAVLAGAVGALAASICLCTLLLLWRFGRTGQSVQENGAIGDRRLSGHMAEVDHATTAPPGRRFPMLALGILGIGLGWFFGSLAFFAIGQAIEARGGSIEVPEFIGFLIYLGPWCAGPSLILIGGILCALALVFNGH